MSTQASAQPPTIQCAGCGTSIQPLPDDRLLFCPSCDTFSQLGPDGQSLPLENVRLQPGKLDRDAVKTMARKWMAEGFWKAADLSDLAEITKLEAIAAPFWALEIRSRTYWSGMNKRSRSVGTGDQRRNQTYWEPVSGDFSKDHRWTIYARKDPSEIMGLDALQKGVGTIRADWGRYLLGFQSDTKTEEPRDLLANSEPFHFDSLPGIQVVPGQVDRNDAEHQTKQTIEGLCRDKAKNLADRVIDCDTALDAKNVQLVFLPLWQMKYRYRGQFYHALIDGGDGHIISAAHPVGKWDKVVLTSMVMGVMAAGGALAAWLAQMPSLWIIPYASIGLVALHASWTALFARG